ncbi:hypothetical protein PENSPDRAFT_325374 [Peniophora sp. CONT]|nr:hypothetical protein PENSPDRAFT_325374 [Peniophora sp. CONT]
MTFFAAYQAYSDSQQQQFFLESAKTSWNTAAQGFVNQAAATSGSIPGVPPFESTCAPLSGGTPTTVAGAVFWVGQPIINGETIGPWIALSSSLYTATLNTTFRDAAQLSIQFVKNFLSNGTMILDTYEIQSCSLMGPGTFTYNGGYFLQGASVYYSNVSTASAQDLAYLNELAASLILFPGWTGVDGVNFEDHITNTTADLSQEQLSADWKAILMTGLYNCLSAGLFNDTVTSLVEQYISVQFNAVRELANYTTSGINEQVYGPSWVTPPIHLQQYLAFGQLAAAELLTTALGVGPGPESNSNNSSPNTVATTSAVSSQASGRQVNVGAIAGGVVGGVAVLVGILIGALCWRRKKRRVIAPVLEVESPWPEPYMATTEQYPIARHASTLAPAADATGRLTKLQHMRYIPTSSDLSVVHESTSQSGGSSTGPPTHADEQVGRNATGMVAVDAEALQRLLHGIGGALSDLQRRDVRHSTITSMSPPDYYEEMSGERR